MAEKIQKKTTDRIEIIPYFTHTEKSSKTGNFN